MLCQMIQSIISGRRSLMHYFTPDTSTTHPCFKRKGVLNLKFVCTPLEMRSNERFIIIAHYETSY